MNVTVLNACRFLRTTLWRRIMHQDGRFQRAGFWFGGERRTFLLGAVLLVGTLSLATSVAWNAYYEAEEQAQRTVQNLAQVLEQSTARNLELYNLAFEDVIAALQIPGLLAADPELRHAALFSRISQARYMSSLFVLDEHGDLVAESKSIKPRHSNFADRDFF